MPTIAAESFQGSLVVEGVVVADHPMIAIEERFTSLAGRILKGPRILVAPCYASDLIVQVMEVQDQLEATAAHGGPRVTRAPKAHPSPARSSGRLPAVDVVPRSAFLGD